MLWWFLETTLVAGLLAAAAALIGRLSTISSTARHLLWFLVLVKLVTPPVIPAPWAIPSPRAFWPEVRAEAVAQPLDPISITPSRAGPDSVETIISNAGKPIPPAELDAQTPIASGTARLIENVSKGKANTGRAWRRILMDRLDPRSVSVRLLAVYAWSVGSLMLAFVQGLRILAFRKRLREAVPAPNWLVAQAEELGVDFNVGVPELLVVPGLGTPMLWCLGPPKLLLPAHLLKSIEAARWRGVLAHELAHLLRGDHWVGRIELVAGLLWWWNPLYWLTCRRLDAEAELACDAWVVWALPQERLDYAEVLFQVCSEFSHVQSRSPSPALGVAGSGRFFERRLTMILNERASCRVSPIVVLAAGLLALLSLPSWTLATPGRPPSPTQDAAPAQAVSTPGPDAAQVSDDGDDDNDDDREDADDEMDDDDDSPEKGEKSADRRAEKDSEKPHKSDSKKGEIDFDIDVAGIEKQVKDALGPDFEKKMEAWADKFAKEIEEKFGEHSEFAKKMEKLGKDLEKKFGDDSEFAKKMEELGKQMEKKFGPGSDFEKNIKDKFGPGSDFEKNIKDKFGPGSEFEKKIKSQAEAMAQKAKSKADKLKAEQEARARAAARANQSKPSTGRKARIEQLETQIQLLLKELKELKETEEHGE